MDNIGSLENKKGGSHFEKSMPPFYFLLITHTNIIPHMS